MIETMAARMARYIKNSAPDHPASLPVLKYALSVSLNIIFIVALTLGIAFLTDKVVVVTLLMFTFAFLRQLTGGFHLKTGMSCVWVTTIGFTTLSFVSLNYTGTFIATIISIALILIFAPSGIEKQSRIPKRFYPLLKCIGLVLVATNLWLGSSIIAISFLSQSLTLIRLQSIKK